MEKKMSSGLCGGYAEGSTPGGSVLQQRSVSPQAKVSDLNVAANACQITAKRLDFGKKISRIDHGSSVDIIS